MNEITDALGQVIGGVFGNPDVQTVLRLTFAYLSVLWLASAWWTWGDARARWRDPISPCLAAAGVVLLTPLLFPAALIVYRVVRPSQTIAERRTAELERELLEADVEQSHCAACGAVVDEDWMRCPRCGSALATRCRACGRQLGLDWTICAWCAAEVPWSIVPLPGDPSLGPDGFERPGRPRRSSGPVRDEPRPAARGPGGSLRRGPVGGSTHAT